MLAWTPFLCSFSILIIGLLISGAEWPVTACAQDTLSCTINFEIILCKTDVLVRWVKPCEPCAL
jgi:hypothetical protein